MIITMTLGGLWHGASLHFLAWGLFHGCLLALHREFKQWRQGPNFIARKTSDYIDSKFGRWFSILATFQTVCLGWVLFRAENIAVAWAIITKLLFLDAPYRGIQALHMVLPTINYPLIYPCIYFIVPLLALGHVLSGWIQENALGRRSPKLLKAAWCLSLMLLIVVFSPDKSPRFIYFQF
jgi:hypothetical protein